MLDISKDGILDDTTFINIIEFSEQVQGEIKMHITYLYPLSYTSIIYGSIL